MRDCRGFIIPHYRTQKHTENNQFYLADKTDNLKSVNTTDEFVTTLVYREIESICADCRQTICRGSYGSKEERKEEDVF
jgi:uncharacterized membrane-anchored protein